MRPLGLRLWQGLDRLTIQSHKLRRPSGGWGLCRLSDLRCAILRDVMGPSLRWGDDRGSGDGGGEMVKETGGFA